MISQTDGLGQAQAAVSGALGQAPQTTRLKYSNLSVSPVATTRRDLGVGCYIKVKAIKLKQIKESKSTAIKLKQVKLLRTCTAIKLKHMIRSHQASG